MKHDHRRFCRIGLIVILTAPGLLAAEETGLAPAQELLNEGRYKEAAVRAKEAQRAYASTGDKRKEGTCWFILGMAELMSNELTASAADLQKGASMLEDSGDHFSSWMALWALGTLERSQKRPEDALARHYRGLSMLRAAEASLQPFTSEGLTYLGKLFGMPEELLQQSSARPDLVKPIFLRIAEVMSRNGAADVFLDEGRTQEAEAELTQATSLSRLLGGLFDQEIAMRLKELGHLSMRAGHHEKAAVHLESAIRLLQQANAPSEEARIWILLVQVYSHFQSRDSARAALERARELSSKSRARLPQAMSDMLAVLEKSQEGESDTDELEKSFMALLELPEAREALPPERIQSWQAIMSDLLPMSSTGALPTVLCRDPGRNANVPGAEGVSRLICGFAHYQRSEFAQARALWRAALKETPRREIEVYLLVLIGRSYERERKINKAIEYLERAVAVVERSVEDVRVEEFLAGFMGDPFRQELYSKLIETLLRKGRNAKAFSYMERARSRAFLQGLGNPRLDPAAGADTDLGREAEALRTRIIDLERQAVSVSPGEQERLLSELEQGRRRYQSLRVRLKAVNPEVSSLSKIEPLRVQAIRDELPPDTTLISYFVSPARVHAWVLDKDTFRHVTLRLSPSDLRSSTCWAERVGHHGGRGARPIDSKCGDQVLSSEDLYEKLITPISPHIHHRRLILVPHADLHYLPFTALRNPKTGRYLIEEYTLTYVPSASALLLLRGRETPVLGGTLVLGEPENFRSDLADLPGAKAEAATVARYLGTTPRLGPMAEESLLYSLNGKVDLIHIAAHGIYEPASSLFSRIVLAPGKGRDGILEIHEILSDLDLSGVNLVVLSACRTAVGERSGGDEIVGLTYAFLLAGTPGVISTLWEIDDDASAILMKELYRLLLAGASVADALREAQLTLLRHPRYQDPYFWAAFNLTGNPQGRWGPPNGSSRGPRPRPGRSGRDGRRRPRSGRCGSGSPSPGGERRGRGGAGS